MINQKLAIIGVGNMGGAIANGLLHTQTIAPENLILSNPTRAELIEFEKRGVSVTSDNVQAVQQAQIVILAVKPLVLLSVLQEIQPVVSNQLFISVVAGIGGQALQERLGSQVPIIRVMPNLAATVGESMSVWVKNSQVSQELGEIAQEILQAIGSEIEVQNENLLDAVTAISGSGPAYVFYLVELLQQAAVELGIDEELAQRLSRQTVIGSSLLLKYSEGSATELRQAVTSKGGTTEAAFKVFEDSEFKTIFQKAVMAAHNKAKELKG